MTSPNQNIPADLTPGEVEVAREWATSYLNGFYNPVHMDAAARVLQALLPPPPRPTMADMTPVARRDCQWMQCDVSGERRIITLVLDDHNYAAVTLAPSGYFSRCSFESVTPRPDLPRLELPGTEKADDENTVKIGDVIESADDPRIAELPDGSVLLDREGEATAKRNHSWRGAGYTPVPSQGVEFGPWAVVRIGQENE